MDYWRRAVLHVDMDAFYASVEQLDHPEWRGRPVAVCGPANSRGVVSAASYEIRAYGVKSAMPTARAMRLCPGAVFTPPRLERYAEVSERVFAVFSRVTPLVQPVSLDEAFLDVTGCQRLHGDPVRIARRIRKSIRLETGLTASVGVASCRFVAKIASDLDKPDGLTVIPEEEILERLAPLPVGKIWGVGPVTRRRLEKLGIVSIGQLAQWPEEALAAELGSAGRELSRLANGIDPSPVTPEGEEKSISGEHTFAADVTLMAELKEALLEQAERVAERLRKNRLVGRVVCLKLRYGDFTAVTRRKTLPAATCLVEVIWAEAARLLRERSDAGRRPVRLIGVGLSGLAAAEGDQENQGRLFFPSASDAAKLERLARATDRIRDKMGRNAIQRASLRFREGK
ncbi:MAG: DNA polymerase IV [Planctomycetota bacterium]|jgi:DNA polymerase-4|nr:DNA polymerase IV [Planctomycetota bacterium]